MPLLTAGQIEAFWRTGFLAVERLTCQDDLGRIRRRLSTLFARFHELPGRHAFDLGDEGRHTGDRKSTRLNSSHGYISYAVFCLKKKKKKTYCIASKNHTTS